MSQYQEELEKEIRDQVEGAVKGDNDDQLDSSSLYKPPPFVAKTPDCSTAGE